MTKAKKGSAASTKTNSTGGDSQTVKSDNPMDWLFDNPLGSYSDFNFGVLRKTYNGHSNSANEFVLRKLLPGRGTIATAAFCQSAVTAYRYGTILPRDVPDELDDVRGFLSLIERAPTSTNPAILVSATLGFPNTTKLHHAWEESRAFCLQALARARQLPVLLVQHRPGEIGSPNPVHSHLLICPRRMDGTGLRGVCDELVRDDGQAILHAEWMKFREAWEL